MPTLEMPFTFIFCDFEDLNIAECYAPGRFFAFVAKTQMTKWGKCVPHFATSPKMKVSKIKSKSCRTKDLSEDEKNT